MHALKKTSTMSSSSSASTVNKPKSFFSRLFHSSTRTSNIGSSDPEAILRDILALNARHGHPEVQAYSVPILPHTPSKRSRSSAAHVQPPPKYSKRPAPTSQEVFDEIMRLNRTHGAPDVQALSFK
ncbi:hypothetical protein JCM11251_001702 [Rhodosporidiobolus azoricus]